VAQRVILVGGGGHARVVGEAIVASGLELIGYVDPMPVPATSDALRVPYLGNDEAIERYPDAVLALGVGAVGLPHRRRIVAERLGAGRRWVSIVHPSAYVSPSASMADGAVILPRAMLHAGVRAGAHSLVNSGATVDHDSVLGEHVLIGPGAVLGGGVVVGDDAFIGMGAIIRNNVHIGSGAVVAMGAVVVSDVAAGLLVRGVPARPLGGA